MRAFWQLQGHKHNRSDGHKWTDIRHVPSPAQRIAAPIFEPRLRDTSLASDAAFKSIHLCGVEKPSGLMRGESQPCRSSSRLTPRGIGGKTASFTIFARTQPSRPPSLVYHQFFLSQDKTYSAYRSGCLQAPDRRR